MHRLSSAKTFLLLSLGVALVTSVNASPVLRVGATKGPHASILPNNNGDTQVPEPASLACLLVGGLGVIRKRSKRN